MKKILILMLILFLQNLNGKEYKIKGDHFYIKGNVQISNTEYFNNSDYNSIEIFVYCKRPHTQGVLLGKTTVNQSGQYELVMKTEELKIEGFMTKRRRINSDYINIKIKSPKYKIKSLMYSSNDYFITNEKFIQKNTFELNPFVLDLLEDWVEEEKQKAEAARIAEEEEEKQKAEAARIAAEEEEKQNHINKINNLAYNIDKMDGPYDSDGFTDFYFDGNNYFLWNKKDRKRGMYRSVDSGENWTKMTWDGIEYLPSNVYIYDDEYLFQSTTKDNPDGVWYSYHYDKKVWSVYEIDEFEKKIFNAEKDNWDKERNSQKSNKFPIERLKRYKGNAMDRLYYKFYRRGYGKKFMSDKYNLFLPYKKWNMDDKERKRYLGNYELAPLLSGKIYERNDDVFVLNNYGLFKLMIESEIESASNYNKMIHDNFKECKSFIESDLKSALEYIDFYKLRKMLDDGHPWNDGLLEAIMMPRKGAMRNYKYNSYSDEEQKIVDKLKKLIQDEVDSFPMFYPVPVNGIHPSEISDVISKNDTLFVLTSLYNGKARLANSMANKLFLYDGNWHTIFDPFINDVLYEFQRLSIEMLDNVDDIIFISPSKKVRLPNNIYYLNHTQDNSIKNNENKYALLPYRDKTGSIIDYAYTDKSGKLWTIEKNNPATNSWKGWNSQLYRYKSINDYSDPLLIQEWKPVSPSDFAEAWSSPYNPESDYPASSSIKLVKTDDSMIYLIKDNTIKQIGAGRDKDFIYKHNKGNAFSKGVLVNYTFFPYKNDVIMFNFFDHIVRKRDSYAFERKIVPKLTNYFHIQIGVNKGVNQNITSTPYSLIKQLNRLNNLNSEVDSLLNIKYDRKSQILQLNMQNWSGNTYTLDSLGTLKYLFEKREINQFVGEDFHIDSELRNGYNQYSNNVGMYNHKGGRGRYKIRCAIGNNDEILIYNYPTGIYYLRNGEITDMKPLDYFDKMKVSKITNDKNGYLIGTYSSGLYKVSIVTN